MIHVKDVNDNPPVFERPTYRTQITEEDDRNLPKRVLQVLLHFSHVYLRFWQSFVCVFFFPVCCLFLRFSPSIFAIPNARVFIYIHAPLTWTLMASFFVSNVHFSIQNPAWFRYIFVEFCRFFLSSSYLMKFRFLTRNKVPMEKTHRNSTINFILNLNVHTKKKLRHF